MSNRKQSTFSMKLLLLQSAQEESDRHIFPFAPLSVCFGIIDYCLTWSASMYSMARWSVFTFDSLLLRFSIGTALRNLANALLTAWTRRRSRALRRATRCGGFSRWGMCLYTDLPDLLSSCCLFAKRQLYMWCDNLGNQWQKAKRKKLVKITQVWQTTRKSATAADSSQTMCLREHVATWAVRVIFEEKNG